MKLITNLTLFRISPNTVHTNQMAKETFGPSGNLNSMINAGTNYAQQTQSNSNHNNNGSIKAGTLGRHDVRTYMTEKPTVVVGDKKRDEKFRSPSSNTVTSTKKAVVAMNRYEMEEDIIVINNNSNNNNGSNVGGTGAFMRTNKTMDKSPSQTNMRLNSANKRISKPRK